MVEFSVLIHVHDEGRHLAECLDSVLTQAPLPEEIIVYASGPRGEVPRILSRYPNVRLLQSDEGASLTAQAAEARAIETAFAFSHGALVFCLEAQDRFKPGRIQRYAAAFEEHPDAALVQAPMDNIGADGRVIGRTLIPAYHIGNHLREIYRTHDVNFFYPLSALAFSRYYLKRVLPFDSADDGLAWADARLCVPAAYYGRIVTLTETLTDRRVTTEPPGDRPTRSDQSIRQTLARTRLFNAFCRRHGLRTISPWRNRRLYLQLLHCALPPAMATFVRRRVWPMLDRFA